MNTLWRTLNSWRVKHKLAYLAAHDNVDEPVRGITLIVPFTQRVSLSKTCRDFARALREANIPFQVFDTCAHAAIPPDDYASLITPPNEFNLYRYSTVVELYRSNLPPPSRMRHPLRRARIVFHDSAAGILQAMPFLDTPDEIIAMSDFNADYFRQSLTHSRRIHKLLYPFVPPVSASERTPRNELRARFGIAPTDFVVFFNFDIGSYYRKNPLAAIKAFALAFGTEPHARLLFKVKTAATYPQHVAEINSTAKQLGIADRFTLITEYLPRRDLDGLSDMCDVYLSLHKSEGFGITVAEAMALGHPAVVTDWSATTEFCNASNSIPVPYHLVPIQPWEYVECLKEWAQPDVDAAAHALRQLYDDPQLRVRLGASAKEFIATHFSKAAFLSSLNAFLDSE